MSVKSRCIACAILIVLIFVLLLSDLIAQTAISINDVPLAVGTFTITENDTVDTVHVDVGLPGENMVWRFDSSFPGRLVRQLIVAKDTAPFYDDFPDAGLAVLYEGRLGDILHSYYFDETRGNIYCFQKRTADGLLIQGVGLGSVLVVSKDFTTSYTGSIRAQPDILLHPFPMEYGTGWQSVSRFVVEVDTVILGAAVVLKAEVKDSVDSIVDGWGTLILPDSTYECLRVKNYVTLNERLTMNDMPIRPERQTRTIYYYWVNEKYGVVARIVSHSDQADDNFTFAKQVSRLHLFNPTIQFSIPDTIGAPGDTLALNIIISDVTDLKISGVALTLTCNPGVLLPYGVTAKGGIAEQWGNPMWLASDSCFSLNVTGDTFLSGHGVLCSILCVVDPNADANDSTMVAFHDITVAETGPHIISKSALFSVRFTSSAIDYEKNSTSPEVFELFPAYPNPFNSTTTISYRVPEPGVATVRIYTILGQEIYASAVHHQGKGIYRMQWNGSDLINQEVPSGVYFCHLKLVALNDSQRRYDEWTKFLLIR